MITEWELECAIYSRFDLVLPDLHAQGYRIERQVLLTGISRRMDIVLTRDAHAWIIELKRALPMLPIQQPRYSTINVAGKQRIRPIQ